jgi:glycosyltransferase involved in cell wall biosynthesis
VDGLFVIATAASSPNATAAPAFAPRVSIIVPAYNMQAYLDETVASVVAQSFANFELLIVDDGSTDDTLAKAKAWAERDHRVQVLTKANGGLANARNFGLAAARGHWVLFLDGDDWLAEGQLQHMLRRAEEAPEAVLVACSCAMVDDDKTLLSRAPVPDLHAPFENFAVTCAFSVHCALVKRDAIQALGGFDEALKSAEDWDLWQRLARTGAHFVTAPDIWALYRRRAGSMSRAAVPMVEAISAVLRRAHRADPRVTRPAPRWADGAPSALLAPRLANIVFYNAGVGLGAGQDVAGLWATTPEACDVVFDARKAAGIMVGGMAWGAGGGLDQVRAEWRAVAPRLEAFCAASGAFLDQPRQADLLRAYVEGVLLGGEAFVAPLITPHVLARRVILGQSPPALHATSNQCIVTSLCRGGAQIGLAESFQGGPVWPALRHTVMGRGALAAAVELRLLAQPRFWRALAQAAGGPREKLQAATASGAAQVLFGESDGGPNSALQPFCTPTSHDIAQSVILEGESLAINGAQFGPNSPVWRVTAPSRQRYAFMHPRLFGPNGLWKAEELSDLTQQGWRVGLLVNVKAHPGRIELAALQAALEQDFAAMEALASQPIDTALIPADQDTSSVLAMLRRVRLKRFVVVPGAFGALDVGPDVSTARLISLGQLESASGKEGV